MGIFDSLQGLGNLNPDQTQGLLAAAAQMLQQSGPSRTPTNLGQIVGGGLGAYQQGMDASKKRKQDEEQAKQLAQLRGLEIQSQTGTLEQQAMARQQAARIKARMAELEGPQAGAVAAAPSPPVTPGPNSPIIQGGASQDIPSFMQGAQPTPQAAAPSAKTNMTEDFSKKLIAQANIYQQEGDTAGANALIERAMKLQPQVQEIKAAVDPSSGQLVNVITFKDGSQKTSPFGVQPDLKMVDSGGKIDFVNMNSAALPSIAKSQTPDNAATVSATLRGQDKTDLRARDFNSIQVEANNIKRDEKKSVQDMTKAGQVASFDTMLGTLDRLGKHPGLSRSVGLASKLPTMPGSDSANFQAELNTFQSQAFIPMVAQLKGMGALSDAEGKKLTAAVGALDPNMGEKAFRESVKRITDEMLAARARVSGESRPAANSQPVRKSVVKGQVIDGYRFKGGDPGDQNNWEKR